jgi:TM2 domain-containing membrane protein YozV
MSSPGVAALLASLPLIGWAGADKFYIGRWDIGLIQLILTITVIGSLVSIPWSILSAFVLLLGIVSVGGSPICCYPTPSTGWAPVTSFDKVVGWIGAIIIVLYIFGSFWQFWFPSSQRNR